MSDISNFQEFTFLLLKRRWIQKLVFEDGGVPKHQQNKNLPDTNNFDISTTVYATGIPMP
jgi:hypothetical protein